MKPKPPPGLLKLLREESAVWPAIVGYALLLMAVIGLAHIAARLMLP